MSSSSEAGGAPIRRRLSCRLMHRAIESSTANFEDLQKLLDKGHTFCRDDGLNCFIRALRDRTEDPKDLSRGWDLLMKMLQVEPRGILARDSEHKTLLNYVYKDVGKIKHLIELGADLNNVDKAGETLIQNLLSNSAFLLDQHWDMLIEHQKIQMQVTRGDFFDQLVLKTKDPWKTEDSYVARKVFCNLIQKGLMSVDELQEKLQMHPLFFIIQLNCIESLQLLLNIWNADLEKNKNLSDLGIDHSIVDKNGKSLVECLFNPDLIAKSSSSYFQKYLALEIWKLMIRRSEIQSQASKDGFFRSLASLAKTSSLVRDLFFHTFKFNIWSIEKLTSELMMHPLFFLLELSCGDLSRFQELMKPYPYFLKDKTILVTKQIVDWNQKYPSWTKVKDLLNIPDILTFDVFGYILFTFPTYKWKAEFKVLSQCLTTLLEHGFVPSQAAGVVHPIHALLYKMFINSSKADYTGWCIGGINLSTLQKTMNILKDFPVPHKLVLDPETGILILDVHLLLMNPMLKTAARVVERRVDEDTSFDVMLLMQLSPCHPLQHFAMFYKYSYCYFQNRQGALYRQTFCKLLRLLLEASGRHRFQGVNQPTMESISFVCEDVDEFLSDGEFKEISLHRKAALKPESEMSSLQWMCILQIRKTLFQRRSSPTVTLPSLIRGLVAEGHLPQGLEADVLVYKTTQ